MTLGDQLRTEMLEIGRRAVAAARAVRGASAEMRTAALEAMARRLRANAQLVLAANAIDIKDAQQRGVAAAFLDRMTLTPDSVEAMARAVETIAAQPDPVGAVLAAWDRPNGLHIARMRTPLGVIGMIFESRPNVAAEAGALALRSGNAIILRGGSDGARSAAAIVDAVRDGVAEIGLPSDCIQAVPSTDRAAVGLMLQGLDGAIDVIVPRGGKSLVARVQEEARVPVFAHLEGICHTYVHVAADHAKAIALVLNAKMRRVSVCGATETVLIDRDVAPSLLPGIVAALQAEGCELRGDAEARAIAEMAAATEADWTTEYLASMLAVRVVSGVSEAIDHIRRYGSQHTECIVTEDAAAAETFLRDVDSAIVMHNASTQFADGGEFGFGGEIGIATGRLHARGPIGAEQLTTFKYVVRGNGQTRDG